MAIIINLFEMCVTTNKLSFLYINVFNVDFSWKLTRIDCHGKSILQLQPIGMSEKKMEKSK